jgi:hypothetical protein
MRNTIYTYVYIVTCQPIVGLRNRSYGNCWDVTSDTGHAAMTSHGTRNGGSGFTLRRFEPRDVEDRAVRCRVEPRCTAAFPRQRPVNIISRANPHTTVGGVLMVRRPTTASETTQ